ncbi:hypothetical protein B2D45_03575 [Lactobacillus hilgardii]|uniref:Uncharacterized protein n=1 Tax=Lentilactobacillus hilgardii (strain ATCC 8290 / DSM 20176 / CCUG 30140 / JCM 1155 / KCTC 3500 / NBRC 15886 / NCIMB 8040 / NRRL B-1843 / 9) TaxID=1423757 RepID=C0XKS0_LENH9|nr:hypothetical protein HMPREF0497_1270 [Lentilactobacillus buchneri ATCC 11577]EEI24065.1 hypothetical protein HMPREF0519_1831 [Lentilactobacillus hilgardii DSM 20176 = ATCC 8290]MCT3396785.1 hypothetical protein [Lentilactobacillus hilgardii]QEU38283.1 hypothetical protein LH500_04840 [Lentilactobacillus hilgardii]
MKAASLLISEWCGFFNQHGCDMIPFESDKIRYLIIEANVHSSYTLILSIKKGVDIFWQASI